jgi:hypothetical protein
MGRNESQPLAFDLDFDLQHPAPLGLALVFEHAMHGTLDWKSRQDRNAVLPALVIKIRRKRVLHSREAREFGDLVFTLRSLDTAIDFLQTDQIRSFAIDHVSDALQVQLFVHADPDVNVVSHHSQRSVRESWRNRDDKEN